MIKRIAIWKWNITIGYSVLGVPGLALVVAKTLQEVLATAGYDIGLRWIFPAGLVVLWTTGWAWRKLGLYSAETSYCFEDVEYYDKHVKQKPTNERTNQ